jgi:uncharacterized membrane protein
MELLTEYVRLAGEVMEITGVTIMLLGAAAASIWFLIAAIRTDLRAAYSGFRRGLGRVILLGLEFLVAGDIIRTVVIDPNMQSVLVLGIIVLIRTFLSMTLEVELEGRLPWRQDQPTKPSR